MTDDELFAMVEEMRQLQREFYFYRNPDDRPPALLPRCKAMERQVDRALAERKSTRQPLLHFAEDR